VFPVGTTVLTVGYSGTGAVAGRTSDDPAARHEGTDR
jgi:hypothetical protein